LPGEQQLANWFVEDFGRLLRNRQEQTAIGFLLLQDGPIEQELAESDFKSRIGEAPRKLFTSTAMRLPARSAAKIRSAPRST
jgi:hypothetical protein